MKKKSLREWKLVFNTNVTYALIYVFALFTLFCYSKVTLLALSVPNEGYLFQKCVVRTKFDIRLHYHHWVDTSACGLLVIESIIRPVVSVYQHCVSTSLGRYLCLWTISPREYHSPSIQ